MQHEQVGQRRAGASLQWLREDPRRLLLVLVLAMALPLALLLPHAPAPPEPVVEAPAVAREVLPDFAAIGDVRIKKRRFFDYLLPLIEAQNERALARREFLHRVRADLRAQRTLDQSTRLRLHGLGERYRVDVLSRGEIDDAALELLLRRIDVLPPSLVLAQAATESAWGTSRFARTANNLFGEWCFTAGCGVVPARRAEGATHEVELFDTVAGSIDSYFRNLNSHPAYAELRERRARARRAGRSISGADLAGGLTRYSERGQAYVDELRLIIRVNGLAVLDVSTPASQVLAGS